MGAWGVGPFASDGALDWLGSSIEDPIIEKIRETLEHFLHRKMQEQSVLMRDDHARVMFLRKKRRSKRLKIEPSREVKMVGRGRGHDEAEAAAALLDELTPYGTRWKLFNYVKWAAKQKKLPKRRKRGSFVHLNLGMEECGTKADIWKHGRSPGVLPDGCRLILDRSDSKARLSLNYTSEHTKLYSLAVRVVREIMEDDAYLSSWDNGSEKRAALRTLVNSLDRKALTEESPLEKKIREVMYPRHRRRRLKRRRKVKASKKKKP